MIATFKDAATRELFETGKSRRIRSDLQRVALRKLKYLQAATKLDELRMPPGNRLESLHGDREGQYSIQINDQYRICFVWDSGEFRDVEIVDYH
jgi:proteic killer suppression protein